MNEINILSPVITVIWVSIGILISLFLPISIKLLKDEAKNFSLETNHKKNIKDKILIVWNFIGGSKYLKILLSTIIIATVVVFLLGLKFYTERDAALAGFAWESLVNKLFGYQKNPSN